MDTNMHTQPQTPASPLLSIGIIFRNDIRCIERCLKALEPLRKAVPCELIMADTGSEDGSREIAEQYADILIDFPWIDDFAAARNSVLDRSSGKWFLTIDTDEWLDKDISELKEFLTVNADIERPEQFCTVVVRNYDTYDSEDSYSDFMAARLLRMSTGVRYQGAIHEHWSFGKEELRIYPLAKTILHHDGYVEMNQTTKAGKAKEKRNVQMIQENLKQDPNNLTLRMQLIESGGGIIPISEYIELLQSSLKLIQEKNPGWNEVGPPILRHAVYAAERQKLPQIDEWTQMARDWFPNSMYTRLDIEYASFVRSWNNQDYENCVLQGERYLKAMEDFRNGADPLAKMVSTLHMATPFSEQSVKILLASSHLSEKNSKRTLELLSSLNFTLADDRQTTDLLKIAQDLRAKTDEDTAPLIQAIWEGITQEKPSKKKMKARETAFVATAGLTLDPVIQAREGAEKGFLRHRYTLYLPLQGKCEVGTAAAVLEMEDPASMEEALIGVEDWNKFSIHALLHALEKGVSFPLPGKNLNVEEMDLLAGRLARCKEGFFPLVLQTAGNEAYSSENRQKFVWRRGLLLAAIQSFRWKDDNLDEERGMALAQAFAHMEQEFLSLYYTPEALAEENIFALPPLHRFGWYCGQAFAALGNGDAASYIRLLRTGLDSCKDMKLMVEFLADHTEQVQALLTPPELQALAEQVRMILARYSPNDPAVAALKNSPAYQQVAHLIEGVTPPLIKDILQ